VKTVLIGEPPAESDESGIQHVKTMIAATKLDDPDAQTRLEIAREMFAGRFPIHALDTESGNGLEDLRNAIYAFLKVIRVYTKKPGKPPDMDSPYSCPVGSTVQDLATLVHRELAEKLKTARVWGEGVFDGQTVTRDHVLHDKDVVELHA
jgi:ribosome-interacting GTPase 1